MKNFGITTFMLRDIMKTKEEVENTLLKIREMGYTEIQRSGCPAPITAAEYRAAADTAGLPIVGTHISFQEILDDVEKVMEEHRILGTTTIGIGALPGEARTSMDAVKRFTEDVNRVTETLYKNGFKFSYHNHSFEFRKPDGKKRIMDVLVEEFDKERISFVLDTYWLQNAGVNPVTWLHKLKGRVDILHLKDMKMDPDDVNNLHGTVFAEIGHGNMEFADILKAAEEIGVKHYIVEQDRGFTNDDPLLSAKMSADVLKNM